MHHLEIRRQIIHMLYGPLLIALYQTHVLNLQILAGMVIGGFLASYLIKREQLGALRKCLAFFEREHHLQQFPGRGILFFTLGTYLALLLFPQNLAFAGILVLSMGDGVSNLVGRHFGRIKTPLNPEKNLEGTVAGILISIPITYYYFPHLTADFFACTVAMFLELPHIRIYNFEIDDNLIIPLAASFTLSLFS